MASPSAGSTNNTKDGSVVRKCRVADKSASVCLSLWNEQAAAIEGGDILKLTKGLTNYLFEFSAGLCNEWAVCDDKGAIRPLFVCMWSLQENILVHEIALLLLMVVCVGIRRCGKAPWCSTVGSMASWTRSESEYNPLIVWLLYIPIYEYLHMATPALVDTVHVSGLH